MKDVLTNYMHKHKFIAIGECGLDYDNFEFSNMRN